MGVSEVIEEYAPAQLDDEPGHESALAEAHGLVNGARQQSYGHPLDNHTTTAEMLAAYVERKYGIRIPFDAEDVCWFNVLQKVSREANDPKRDNRVDVAGYVENVEMIEAERRRRSASTRAEG
jgi:hypothetical protein